MGMEPWWEQMKGGHGQGNRKGGRLVLPGLSFMVPRAKLLASSCHWGRGDRPLGTVFGGCLGGAVVFI